MIRKRSWRRPGKREQGLAEDQARVRAAVLVAALAEAVVP
jgi:hypothetical protein